MSVKFDEFLQEQFLDSEFKNEYEALQPERAIIQAIIDARQRSGLTQKELSERTGIASYRYGYVSSHRIPSNPRYKPYYCRKTITDYCCKTKPEKNTLRQLIPFEWAASIISMLIHKLE